MYNKNVKDYLKLIILYVKMQPDLLLTFVYIELTFYAF